jgi:hypothetical protein
VSHPAPTSLNRQQPKLARLGLRLRRQGLPLGLMLGLVSVLLGLSTEHVTTPLIVLGLIAAHSLLGFELKSPPRFFLCLILAVPFALWWQSINEDRTQVYPQRYIFYLFGFYVCCLGVYHLLCLRHGGRATHATFCAVTGLAFAGVASESPLYLPGLILFVPLLLWQVRQGLALDGPIHNRRGFWIHRGALMLILALLSLGFQLFVIERAQQVDDWLRRQMLSRGPSGSASRESGFSRDTQLGSIQQVWRGRDEEVMLRTHAPEAPEYLRGTVYDAYDPDERSWGVVEETRELEPAAEERGQNLFELAEPRAERMLGSVVPAHAMLADVYFLPMGTHQITGFADRVAWSRGHTIKPLEGTALGGYGFYEQAVPLPPPTQVDLSVPAELVGPLRAAANRMSDPRAPPEQRIGQIVEAFEADFEYRFGGVELPAGLDPIVGFLQVRQGHCEWFASATTLMLRSIGLNARYVTGFVSREAGPGGGYWISRRKDAHAWVEVYLPGEGWQIVEPTPPAGMPQPANLGPYDRISEAFRGYAQAIGSFLRHGGFGAAIGWALAWLTDLLVGLPAFVWVIVIVGGILYTYRGPLLRWWRGEGTAEGADELLQWRRVLESAELLLASQGLHRKPSETCSQFRRRVQAQASLPAELRRNALGLLQAYECGRFLPPSRRPAPPDVSAIDPSTARGKQKPQPTGLNAEATVG